MNGLKAGFCRKNADPPPGIAIRGCYKPLRASGIPDFLYLNAGAPELLKEMRE